MTRSKSKPTIRKPVFDEENTLTFAAREPGRVDAALPAAGKQDGPKSLKKGATDQLRLTLTLKREIITRLEEEAARKEKSMEQIVGKLVTKHLERH